MTSIYFVNRNNRNNKINNVDNNPVNTKYNVFNDELINITSPKDYNIMANVIESNRSLVLLIKSDLDVITLATTSIDIYNYDNEKLFSEEYKNIIYSNNYMSYIINLPELNNKYAGKIDIKTTYAEFKLSEQLNYQDCDFTTNVSVDQDNFTTVNVVLNNGNDLNLATFVGSAIAFRNNKIVGFNNFTLNSDMTSEFQFSPENINNQNQKLEYDNLLLFPIFVEFK